MFKNKHIIVAMIVAPILALLSYFATDHVVSEKPHAAIAGQSYKLVAKSNCRYESGLCTLENAELNITLRAEFPSADQVVLLLTSNNPLKGAKIALAKPGENSTPVEMSAIEADTTRWKAQLYSPSIEASSIMLVVAAGESSYYAETGIAFAKYETNFSRDGWANNSRNSK